MILEIISGIFVSILAIISFLSLRYLNSVNNWILATSKFIYYSGHPLLNDDQIHSQITKKFKNVFSSLSLVIFKTILFLILLLIIIAFSSLLILSLKGFNIPDIFSHEFIPSIFPRYLFQFGFITGSLIPIIFAPMFIKHKKIKKESYSPIDKFLHYAFLGNKNIARFIFRIELLLHKKYLKTTKGNQNVYISGLARAGTTVLMQYLGQLSEFKSLSYQNLPFLFLPRTGIKLTSKKKKKE